MANDSQPQPATFHSPERKPAVTATLQFNLDDHEAEQQLRLALNARYLKIVLQDIDEWLRTKLKHGHTFRNSDEALEAARKELHDKLQEYNLPLHD